MNQWPIGLSTGCFYHRSIFEVLDDIHASGFRQIEICSFPKHLDYHQKDQVREAGERMRALELHPFSFHAPFADHIDITSLHEPTRRGAVNELIVACEAAAVMGARNIVLHPGPEREGRPPEEEFLQHMNHAAESLNLVARRCTDLGVNLLLENMLPHLLFGHTSDMLYLLGQIRECNVGTCLDTGHANLAGELGSVVHKLSGHLKMLHANDNLGNSDAHLNPGEGRIDWPWLLGELKRNQFKGSLILELAGYHGESIHDTLVRARRAFDYLVAINKND
ncbi:sugar phosphate isomerase/epimerase [Prosthecobacter fusiformis]|uniref:Sugar phosphate isomerase/epimerase n=1 Tax=Prosthecobacter fusiformis TaxID=48464 RepID=A0A4R7S790_9BACT|nr:sugar phosphate isomerase/epimerase family protein [Prosthecobacter fusiformis]TDU73355.1 sugar phosphate isomerase/epimerase [Prosthecobacter fusiformis]